MPDGGTQSWTSVLFDLDGTLTDPKPGITRSCAYALEKMGHGVIDPDSLTWCIGPPLRGSFAQILGGDAAIEEAIGFYRERFSTIGLYENQVYAGIPELLESLKERELKVFLATSKPQVFAQRILQHFCLDSYFDGVVGSELDGTRDAKAEVIAHVLATFEVDAKRAVMVGDRRHDVDGASAHGIPCLGVLYGYGSQEELAAAGALRLCRSPEEVQEALAHISGVMPKMSMS